MNKAGSSSVSNARNKKLGAIAFCAMAGVTLIELLVTITIAGILIAIATPSYKNITTSNRIAAEVNGLVGDLQFARSEAIKEGQTITVCASSDSVNCSGTNDWKSGWIVFQDSNNDAAIDNTESALKIQKVFSSTDTFQATNSVSAINFNREGIAAGLATGTLIKLHDATNNSNWTRCVYVNRVGLVKPLKYNQADPLAAVTCT